MDEPASPGIKSPSLIGAPVDGSRAPSKTQGGFHKHPSTSIHSMKKENIPIGKDPAISHVTQRTVLGTGAPQPDSTSILKSDKSNHTISLSLVQHPLVTSHTAAIASTTSASVQTAWSGQKTLFSSASPPALTLPLASLQNMSLTSSTNSPQLESTEFSDHDPSSPNFEIRKYYVRFLAKYKCLHKGCTYVTKLLLVGQILTII